MDSLEELRKPHRVKIQQAATADAAERAISDAEHAERWPEFFQTASKP